ncbi:type I glyceraldehyde-3-phosphate dehydrogenase [Hujiaoplasma nucleasis]|uniref:Glyceraldehyde-3-phosphate dehydrogenase n=1 Tax=Hujiaoplasma nucleasis TaxID=2725268 RepID=A0A7L6N2J7_9MOLU|nr:type I glyceraldehyde-3-phosphate dehydrogenase [Hujiaoplasma nucleasis]QLY39448.1 type I glyceraldehyde-3-phosphate dehydrogenase [Hujiaoplasma nucleasis]
MSVKVAINGFGRIGRLAFRIMFGNKDFDIVAINDLTDARQLAYLLKYDSSQGRYNKEVSYEGNELIVEGKRITIFSQRDPEQLPWKEKNVDVVLECTGFFTSEEGANKHIKAGAKKVLISAPAKGKIPTIVYGVNDNVLTGEEKIVSAASCTTNCLAPIAQILNDKFGIVKGFMTTVHAYTNDQATLDIPHPKGIEARRGRAAAANIVPTSTGAAKAVGLVLPELNGKLDGMALRVPVITGSVVDLVVELEKSVTEEDVNKAVKDAQSDTVGYTEDPIVSSDVIGISYGTLFDALSTKVMEVDGKQMVKVITWYDNEYSFTSQMIRTLKKLAQ